MKVYQYDHALQHALFVRSYVEMADGLELVEADNGGGLLAFVKLIGSDQNEGI